MAIIYRGLQQMSINTGIRFFDGISFANQCALTRLQQKDTASDPVKSDCTQLMDLVDPIRATGLKQIADETRVSGQLAGKTLEQALKTGITISSGILGGPAAMLQLSCSDDRKVQANLVNGEQSQPLQLDENSKVVESDMEMGLLVARMPDGRQLHIMQEDRGINMDLGSPDHGVFVRFKDDRTVEAVSARSETEEGGVEWVRLQGDSMEVSRNRNGVVETASDHGFNVSISPGSSLPHDLSLQDMADARDRVLNRLDADQFHFAPRT